MSEVPYHPGGLISADGGPVMALLHPDEPVLKDAAHAREWLARRGVTEDLLHPNPEGVTTDRNDIPGGRVSG